MKRVTQLCVAAALACGVPLAAAQTTTPKKLTVAKAPASVKKTPAARQAEADTVASVDAAGPVSQNQLDIAARVLTGKASCEFDQAVDVSPMEGRPGVFKVGFKNASYTMVPEETTTGAVRLEDKRAGVMWLQIPSKSMLMNSKIGQRMVDACMHAEQRAAVNASRAAAGSVNQ
jgi:hypothetical protein